MWPEVLGRVTVAGRGNSGCILEGTRAVADLPYSVVRGRVRVWSSGGLEQWGGDQVSGLMWHRLHDGPPPTTWRSAAEDLGACGVAVTADTVTVHASAWGVQPLYYLQQGDSWLFCTSLARLVEASSRALHADWDAWASIMVMRHPIGEQTPFEEIRRIRPGGSLHFGHGSTRPTRRVGIPESTEPLARRLSPMDVAETVSRVVGRAAARALGEAPDGSVTLMLSGGWDSRMLGGVLARRMPGDAVRALTTTTHRDGFDADVAFSRAVADRLGIEQEVVDPEATSLPAYYRRAFRRVGYETAEHAWLEPAAALARSRRAPVFDGIAGDVLLKNRMASPIAMRGRTHRERGTLLWQRMAGKTDPRAPLLSAELAHHIRDRAREAFRTEWDLVDGHPEDVRVTVLRTRTARGVAQAPFRMMSPEVSVAAPFLDPEFVTTAMSVERSRKDDGVFYREVLEACVPEVAGLPSTNDAQARQGDGSLKLESVASRAWYTEAVSRAQAQAAPSLPPVVDDGPLSPSDRWRTGLLLLSSWLEEYQERLVSTQAPWWA